MNIVISDTIALIILAKSDKLDLLSNLFQQIFIPKAVENELKIKTPFEAVQSWFQMKPELFKISPDGFRAYAFDRVEQCGGT